MRAQRGWEARGTWISDTAPFPVTIGTSQTGVTIGFGTCIGEPIHALTITVLGQGLTDTCCTYPVMPDPAAPSGEIDFVDCAGQNRTGTSLYAVIANETSGPVAVAGPSPADGAVEQPLETILTYETRFCPTSWLYAAWCDVYFGTTQDPPLAYPMSDCGAYDPGPLEPNTTYFWKIRAVHSVYGAVESPVWQFTTEGPTPVQSMTWGAVKALMHSKTEAR